MKLKRFAILLALALVATTLALHAQYAPPDPAVMPANTVVVHVPGDAPTIQEAIKRGGVVVVAPGHYRENIQCWGIVDIRAEIPNTAVIDGGEANTITSPFAGSCTLRLEGLQIHNNQKPGPYYVAAISIDAGAGLVELRNCVVHSKSVGLMTNYNGATVVENTTFIGPKNAIGIRAWHQNAGKAKFLNNRFLALGAGVDISESWYHPIISETPGIADTNVFHGVKKPYLESRHF